jgi:hypothetical protein
MEEPKDKRTKKWKEWKANFDNENSTGLGDVIEKVTKATGIKKVVDKFTDDCGCQEKKEKANKIRFKWTKVNCFNEDQYNRWTTFRNKKTDIVSDEELSLLREMMIALFGIDIHRPSCCVEGYINEVNKVYDAY